MDLLLIYRTTISTDFYVNYPVLYIKSFIKHDKDNVTSEYEPATLVISSDGKFYILIEGAFCNSPKDCGRIGGFMGKIFIIYLILCGLLFLCCCAGIGIENYAISNDSNNNDYMENEISLPHDTMGTNIEERIESTRIFDSYLDFTYDDFQYADDKVYVQIKDLYISIDFFGDFLRGDMKKYSLYKEKYLDLLNNKVKFLVYESSEEYFLHEFFSPSFNMRSSTYYFFDMNTDENPELAIVYNNSIYIFYYDEILDEFSLWLDMSPSWYQLNGSLKIRWNRGGLSHIFYQLDENGKELFSVYFYSFQKPNSNGEAEEYYMVALPNHLLGNIVITEELLSQAYYSKSYKLLYYRLEEEQYDEITKNYFDAEKLANEALKDVSFSFEELFEK